MYHNPPSTKEFTQPNKGLRREGFRSHFLLFIFDTIMMAGLIACGVTGVVMMDGEKFSTPPFYVASFVSATCIMAKATVGGCFSVHGLFVKDKPEDPETGLVILHLILSVISLVGYLVSIIVVGVSKVLGSCTSSNDTPGCSSKAEIYKALGAFTLVIILITAGMTCFGIYLFRRFGKEFGVSPYSRPNTIKRPDEPESRPKSISIHHNDQTEIKEFV